MALLPGILMFSDYDSGLVPPQEEKRILDLYMLKDVLLCC
jgi:hypothetical protein